MVGAGVAATPGRDRLVVWVRRLYVWTGLVWPGSSTYALPLHAVASCRAELQVVVMWREMGLLGLQAMEIPRRQKGPFDA